MAHQLVVMQTHNIDMRHQSKASFLIFTWEGEQQRMVSCSGGLVDRVGGTSLWNTKTMRNGMMQTGEPMIGKPKNKTTLLTHGNQKVLGVLAPRCHYGYVYDG